MSKRPQDRYGSWDEVRRALATAWSGSSTDRPGAHHVEQIIRAVTAKRESRQGTEAAADRVAQRESEVATGASYQWQRLLDEVAAELADLVNLGTIVVARAPHSLSVSVDGHQVAHASLDFVPEHRFRNGTRSNAVATLAASGGRGFNAVLRRDGEDDMYGRWEGVAWRRNYMTRGGGIAANRPEPFALSRPEIAQHLHVLDGVTSVVQCEGVANIPARFLSLIADCLSASD